MSEQVGYCYSGAENANAITKGSVPTLGVLLVADLMRNETISGRIKIF